MWIDLNDQGDRVQVQLDRGQWPHHQENPTGYIVRYRQMTKYR